MGRDMKIIKIGELDIYNCVFSPINSNMYMIFREKEVLVVDPFMSPEALDEMEKRKVQKAIVLLTHEHYDHISGVNWLRERLPCHVICSGNCSENLDKPKKNLSQFFDVLFLMQPPSVREKALELDVGPYQCYADQVFEDRMSVNWKGINLDFFETPGHSEGSICVIIDKTVLLTGDTLVEGTKTITRLPGGDDNKLQSIAKPWLQTLPVHWRVLPGHGEMGVLKDFLQNLDKN